MSTGSSGSSMTSVMDLERLAPFSSDPSGRTTPCRCPRGLPIAPTRSCHPARPVYTRERRVPGTRRVVPVRLDEIHPSHQSSVVERPSEHLVLASPPGSGHYLLFYNPRQPVKLDRSLPRLRVLAVALVAFWAGGVVVATLVGLVCSPLAPFFVRLLGALGRWLDTHDEQQCLRRPGSRPSRPCTRSSCGKEVS
jgi:hypothetical protein